MGLLWVCLLVTGCLAHPAPSTGNDSADSGAGSLGEAASSMGDVVKDMMGAAMVMAENLIDEEPGHHVETEIIGGEKVKEDIDVQNIEQDGIKVKQENITIHGKDGDQQVEIDLVDGTQVEKMLENMEKEMAGKKKPGSSEE